MQLVGRSAIELARAVRAGRVSARSVVEAHLDHLETIDDRLGAFVLVRREEALREAEDVDGRDDRVDLPLAGVPVAIKDNVDVAGEPTRHGSLATSAEPASEDNEVVARLRRAGAIVIGKTRCPELVIWGTSDDVDGVAVSPWDPSRTAGGSSGGSAAAVAAGIVPIALASDGMGSVRIPSAACGCVGIKPGPPLLLEEMYGEPHWFGMGRIGPITTTVADLRLALDVMAGIDEHRDASGEGRHLRVAVSWASPTKGYVARHWQEVAVEAGRILRHLGHTVGHDDPPSYTRSFAWAVARYQQGPARDVDGMGLDVDRLQPRTRVHVEAGARMARILPVEPEQAERFREHLRPFFARYDVLITPMFARTQPRAIPWHERSWPANVAANLTAYPFCGSWNLADLPAASVPLGSHEGRPLAVQVVAGRGREDVVLAVADQLERAVGWQRHAPGWHVPAST